MYFDGAVNNNRVGIGIIFITPEGEMIPIAKRLEFKVISSRIRGMHLRFRSFAGCGGRKYNSVWGFNTSGKTDF